MEGYERYMEILRRHNFIKSLNFPGKSKNFYVPKICQVLMKKRGFNLCLTV